MQQKTITLALSLALGAGLAHAQSTEYGTGATASGNSATAIGINALAGTTYSGGGPILLIAPSSPYVNQVSVGTATLSWGYGDVAIGTGTVAVSQPPLGSYSAATAVGYRSTVWGNNSIAIGNEAVAGPGTAGTAPTTDITVSNATALGGQARAASTGSTAIGATASLPMAIGTSYYNGEGGLGIAFAQALRSGAIINAGVATTGSGGRPVLRAGAAWKF